MGALQKIRSKSTLLVGVIAVGLLAFVVPWGEITQFLNVSKDRAFVIDGDVIKTGQYSQRIEERENIEKMRIQGGQLNDQQTAQIREEVYQTMVTEALLEGQAEKLGLSVTAAELNDMVYGINVSPVLYEMFADPQTGQVDRESLNYFLTKVNEPTSTDPNQKMEQEMLRERWSYIEKRMKSSRLEEKYASLVAGSVLVNDIEAKAYFDDSKNVATLQYVAADYSSMADSTFTVSDAEIQDLYNIRKENFLSKYPSRTLSYFVKNVVPSEGDYEETRAQILEVKQDLEITENPGILVNQYSNSPYVDAYFSVSSLHPELKSFVQSSSVGDIHGPTREDRGFTLLKYIAKTVAPDSVKIQTIPIQSFDPTLAATIADSLKIVLKGGKSFANLAREMYPTMPQVIEGEWVTERMLAGLGIADKCFAAAKGEVLTVEIQGMLTLLRIEDRTRPIDKAKIAIINLPVIVSDKTNNSIDNEINKFLSENKDPSNFKTAALNSGFNLQSDVVVYPNFPGIENLPSTREVIKWAFNDNKGELKKFETNEARIVALVTGEEKAGYISSKNSQVLQVLEEELIRDKKAEKLMSDISSKNISNLSSLATALNTKVDTAKFVTFQTDNISGVGYEPVLNVVSKIGANNNLTKPLKGYNGVYVVNVGDKRDDQASFDKKATKNLLSSQYNQMLSYSASSILVSKMDVEDNRVKFY